MMPVKQALSFLILWTFLLDSPAIGAEEEIDFETAVNLIKKEESKIKRVRYKFEHNKYVADDSGKVIPAKNEYYKGTFIYDYESKHYHIKYQGTSRWDGGAADYISEKICSAFNGKYYDFWQHSSFGTELPKDIPLAIKKFNGTLDDLLDQDTSQFFPEATRSLDMYPGKNLNSMCIDSGFIYLPGMVFSGDSIDPEIPYHRVSEYLTRLNNNHVISSVRKVDKNVLEFEYTYGGFKHMRVDLDSYALIRYDGNSMIGYEVETDQPGTRLKDLEVFYFLRPIGQGHLIKIKSLEINPKLDEKDFTFEFSPGTKVFDYVNKISYQVGEGDIKKLEDE